MELFPAIDIKGGQVVRLTQGDYDRVKIYAREPAQMAKTFWEQGARNLHMVDLDGARDGDNPNFEQIQAVLALGGLFVEIGGGIRSREAIERYLALGVHRAILGTVAAENFPFVEEAVRAYGRQIAVSVDAREGKVAVRGWRQDSGLDAMEFCKRLEQAGVATIIFTDISRDGLLEGTNLEAMGQLNDLVRCDIIASGGVSTEDEIKTLAEMGLYGAIVGKALYEGTLDMGRILKLC